ncbi:MAG: glycosyltransferase family 4 protein, partial [Armatimonadetes bacterium CG07_land_8_20_14_0_80_40_9]
AREKNVEFLLNVFSLILEKEPGVHFLIVGGGPEEKNLISLAKKLSLGQKVTFTSYLPNEEVLNCYAASDLFVFSSLTETQGLVILEAMASATPVVALSASGVSDVVTNGEDGFLSSPNQALFRDRVVELIRNEELRKKMGRQARKKAERFSSSNSALELANIYKSLG